MLIQKESRLPIPFVPRMTSTLECTPLLFLLGGKLIDTAINLHDARLTRHHRFLELRMAHAFVAVEGPRRRVGAGVGAGVEARSSKGAVLRAGALGSAPTTAASSTCAPAPAPARELCCRCRSSARRCSACSLSAWPSCRCFSSTACCLCSFARRSSAWRRRSSASCRSSARCCSMARCRSSSAACSSARRRSSTSSSCRAASALTSLSSSICSLRPSWGGERELGRGDSNFRRGRDETTSLEV